MPDDSTSNTDDSTDTDDTEIIETSQQYTLGDCLGAVGEGLRLFEEAGDSSFEYVLVGANLDDGSNRIAFGLRRDEFPIRKPRDAE